MYIKMLGQYFTKNLELKKKVYEFILNNPSKILEPSIGRGDLVDYVLSHNKCIDFVMYEIDNTIKTLDSIDVEKVIYQDFMQTNIDTKFDTIIGNPPYVRTKTGNLYIDFIEKCTRLLNKNGELIFIVPSDFMKLTCASKLLNEMMSKGTFTHIYHPHNEHLFEGATIDVLIFRYVLSKEAIGVLYNNIKMNVINNEGMITFGNSSDKKIKDYFDVYVGMVSGKEEVYKDPEGNLDVLNGEDKIEKYIYASSLDDNTLIEKLLPYKDELMSRGIRKFNESNWYEWGAPRNIKIINENFGRECIYVYNLTRRTKVAFIGKCMHFGGNLLMLLPKEDINLIDMEKHINSDDFKRDFTFSNRFKIGQRQLSLASIPSL